MGKVVPPQGMLEVVQGSLEVGQHFAAQLLVGHWFAHFFLPLYSCQHLLASLKPLFCLALLLPPSRITSLGPFSPT